MPGEVQASPDLQGLQNLCEALQQAALLPRFPAFPREGSSGKHCKNSLSQSILAPSLPTGMQKVQRLENLKKKIEGGGITGGFKH